MIDELSSLLSLDHKTSQTHTHGHMNDTKHEHTNNNTCAGIGKGHTGHVRFLTSVELPSSCPTLSSCTNSGSSSPFHVAPSTPTTSISVASNILSRLGKQSSNASSTAAAAAAAAAAASASSSSAAAGHSATRTLVISGGDGFEDFTSNQSSAGECTGVGRDDSTNHLLLWSV